MAEGGELLELIGLAGGTQSVAVRLLSTSPSFTGVSGRYFDAEIQIRSDFVNASVRTGIFDEDIEEWGLLLDALEEVMDDASEDDGADVFTGDWPREGRTAYLRFVAEDPLVIEVRDTPGTGICVQVPLALDDDWITEARVRLRTVREALGA
ncbi:MULTISPECIES: DUF5959 family protein [unclassified Streptomyces]|uniref:DUF5959 family protein n=1 Tax=Streptomyces sp. NPDC127129 TaxID=3345373 RepID=UPI00363F8218